MKYIKKYNEDIEWYFDEEEEPEREILNEEELVGKVVKIEYDKNIIDEFERILINNGIDWIDPIDGNWYEYFMDNHNYKFIIFKTNFYNTHIIFRERFPEHYITMKEFVKKYE